MTIDMTLASASELETQIIIAKNLKYLQEDKYKNILKELNAISRMLQGLIKSVSR